MTGNLALLSTVITRPRDDFRFLPFFICPLGRIFLKMGKL